MRDEHVDELSLSLAAGVRWHVLTALSWASTSLRWPLRRARNPAPSIVDEDKTRTTACLALSDQPPS